MFLEEYGLYREFIMSHFLHEQESKTIAYGYDRLFDYVFIMIYQDEDMIYSNINDKRINYVNQIDFTYFDKVLRKHGLNLPDEEKINILKERATYLDSFELEDHLIKSRVNLELEGKDDLEFVVEVGQHFENIIWYENIGQKEYFSNIVDAYTRVNIINGAFVYDYEDIKEGN